MGLDRQGDLVDQDLDLGDVLVGDRWIIGLKPVLQGVTADAVQGV